MNLSKTLRHGVNPALRMLGKCDLHTHLAQIIRGCYDSDKTFSADYPSLASIIKKCDYRLVAEYLWALRKNKQPLLKIFKKLFNTHNIALINKYRYQLAYKIFLDNNENKSKLLIARTMDEIFEFNGQGVLMYICDDPQKEILISLLKDLKGSVGNFIEKQYDLPGRNALVRQGVVKNWYLPNGVAVVSKRQNPHKPNRFKQEQFNYRILSERLSKSNLLIKDPNDLSKDIRLDIAYPFALINDGDTGNKYAISFRIEGDNLEEILVGEKDASIREKYLKHYRLILDKLYDRGVLWGDMSPRNIIVHRSKNITTYTLVDFEKTDFVDGPVSEAKRIEHCRGQICVEELCVICPLEEVTKCFKGYFDPDKWDTQSSRSLEFKPRPDLENLLRAHRVKNISIGDYNKLDKNIVNIRKPYWDSEAEEYLFPGSIGFKVEHYLSCVDNKNASDYDRKTTEVLLAAQEQNCFREIFNLLLCKANDLEKAMLKSEFLGILERGSPNNLVKPRQEILSLTKTLDLFYKYRYSKKFQYLELLTKTKNHRRYLL